MAQNGLFLSFVLKKVAQSVLNLIIIRFDGSVSENLLGNFLSENVRLDCYFWSDFLNFDARSILPHVRMHLERANLIQIIDKFYELLFISLSSLN